MPSSIDLAIGLGVGALAVVLLIASFFRRGSSSITSQVEAARRAFPAPDRTLATVALTPGVPATLRASVTSPDEEHSVWIEYVVDPGDATGVWRADVQLTARAGDASDGPATFPVGYDGEDHVTRPRLVGVTYVPLPGSSAGIDDGHLRLATLPRAEASAAIEVTLAIAPQRTYPTARWTASIRVAPRAR